MQRLIHHINRVKEQPHHIRRQVALAVALGIAVLIGFVWLVGSLAMGSFAIHGSNFAESVGAEQAPSSNGNGTDATSELAGVGAAADSNNASAPSIQIIDTSTSTAPQPEQTVIPF